MNLLPLLAQQTAPASWAPIVLLLLIAIGFAIGNVVLSLWIGPKRTGAVKEMTYESGMVPVGDARRRFNVRFYLIAIMFVVFDVEVVVLYPWATAFPHLSGSDRALAGVLLAGMLIFTGIILLGFIYEWGKGIFRWD